jgi:hypothetical protein
MSNNRFNASGKKRVVVVRKKSSAKKESNDPKLHTSGLYHKASKRLTRMKDFHIVKTKEAFAEKVRVGERREKRVKEYDLLSLCNNLRITDESKRIVFKEGGVVCISGFGKPFRFAYAYKNRVYLACSNVEISNRGIPNVSIKGDIRYRSYNKDIKEGYTYPIYTYKKGPNGGELIPTGNSTVGPIIPFHVYLDMATRTPEQCIPTYNDEIAIEGGIEIDETMENRIIDLIESGIKTPDGKQTKAPLKNLIVVPGYGLFKAKFYLGKNRKNLIGYAKTHTAIETFKSVDSLYQTILEACELSKDDEYLILTGAKGSYMLRAKWDEEANPDKPVLFMLLKTSMSYHMCDQRYIGPTSDFGFRAAYNAISDIPKRFFVKPLTIAKEWHKYNKSQKKKFTRNGQQNRHSTHRGATGSSRPSNRSGYRPSRGYGSGRDSGYRPNRSRPGSFNRRD